MMYEYGDPRIQVINRRCDGTIIPDEEMDGMVIPVNDRTIVAYRIMRAAGAAAGNTTGGWGVAAAGDKPGRI